MTIKLIDIQCRAIFNAIGGLSTEIWVKLLPTVTDRKHATTTTEYYAHAHPPADRSIEDYIISFNKEVRPHLLSSLFFSQQEVDFTLFSLAQQSELPLTFFSATSIAIAKAASSNEGLPLYYYLQKLSSFHHQNFPSIPIFNILDASNYSGKNNHTVPFLFIPSDKLTLMESLMMGSQVLEKTREICWKRKTYHGVAPQGGVLINLNSCEEGLTLVMEAAAQCGYRADEDFTLGIDFESKYFEKQNGMGRPWSNETFSIEEQLSSLLKLTKSFPLSYVEDPFVSNESDAWCTFMENVKRPIMVVGDEFFSTSISGKIKLGANEHNKSINSFVIKTHRFATVTEILQTIQVGLSLGWTSIISHRTISSGDTFLSHLAVASGSRYIKAGGMCNMEHIGTYNELVRIFESDTCDLSDFQNLRQYH